MRGSGERGRLLATVAGSNRSRTLSQADPRKRSLFRDDAEKDESASPRESVIREAAESWADVLAFDAFAMKNGQAL